MGYFDNNHFPTANPIDAAVDTAAKLQGIFDARKRSVRDEETHALTMQAQQQAMDAQQQDMTWKQDAHKREERVRVLQGLQAKSDEYERQRLLYEEAQKHDPEQTQVAPPDLPTFDPTEDALIKEQLAGNPAISNNPFIALKQAGALVDLQHDITEISPLLLSKGSRVVMTSAEKPDFFKKVNVALGPTINKGTGRKGEPATKAITKIYVDENNNIVWGLTVTPQDGSPPYESIVTADRADDPNAPVVRTPAAIAAAYINGNANYMKVARPWILSQLAKEGDQKAASRIQDQLNDTASKIAAQRVKEAVAQLQQEAEARGEKPPIIGHSQLKEMFIRYFPDSSATVKEKRELANTMYGDKQYIPLTKYGVMDGDSGAIITSPVADKEDLLHFKMEGGGGPAGSTQETEYIYDPKEGKAKAIATGSPKLPKPDKSGTAEKAHVVPAGSALIINGEVVYKNPDKSKVAGPVAEVDKWTKSYRTKLQTLFPYLTKEKQALWTKLDPEGRTDLILTPGALTPEGKQIFDKYGVEYNAGAKLIEEGKTADEAYTTLHPPVHHAIPAAAATPPAPPKAAAAASSKAKAKTAGSGAAYLKKIRKGL